ncbi:PKD domain-containing protein [bacterium]|nr:PKD domain-containing protein [bacterium]
MSRIIAFAIIVVLTLMVVSCGKDEPLSGKTDYAPEDRALLTAELQDALTAKLIELGKIDPVTGEPRVVSTPPSGEDNHPELFDYETLPDNRLSLSFIERNVGDYDLSGDVGIPDITPIALNYLSEVTYDAYGIPTPGQENEELAVIDGDMGGEIGISDITPIANNYLVTLAGYNLYRSGVLIPGDGGAPTMPRPTEGKAGWRDGRWPVYEFTDEPGGISRTIIYSVAPVDTDGTEGEHYNFSINYELYSPNTPPEAPTGLIATPGDGVVYLDWNDNTEEDLLGYDVYQSTNPDFPSVVPVNEEPVAVSEYTAIELENETTYYFWVKALDDATPHLKSPFSSRVEATPESVTIPPSPTGLMAQPGDTTVLLDWDDNTDPDTAGYNAYKSTILDDPDPEKVNSELLAESQVLVAELVNDTEYFFWASAVGFAGPSSESEKTGPVNATPTATANIPPTAVANANPLAGDAPLDVNFSADGSGDTDGTIVMYRWDFTDDGDWDYEDAESGNTAHIYDMPGEFTALLQVEDDDGDVGEDTVEITVYPSGVSWNTVIVDSNITVGEIALEHFSSGAPAIAASGDDGEGKVLNFYRLEGESFVKDNVRTNTGGDAMQLAVTGGGGVFIGHKQHNGMIEDSGYLNYKIADAFKWTEISYGSIADNVSVTVGGSPEKIACAGLHSFSQESYTFITDVAGDQTESKTGLFTPQIANIAMKSDTEGATWLMAMNLMHIVTFDGETWKLSPQPGFNTDLFEIIRRVEYVENISSYVAIGNEMLSDSEMLSRFIWDGESYDIEIIGAPTWASICKRGAVGPAGEVYYCYEGWDEINGDKTIIIFYLTSDVRVDEVPLEGPISEGQAVIAELDVRPDGIPAIVYQMPDSTVLYYATFPHPLVD